MIPIKEIVKIICITLKSYCKKLHHACNEMFKNQFLQFLSFLDPKKLKKRPLQISSGIIIFNAAFNQVRHKNIIVLIIDYVIVGSELAQG